MFRDQYNLYQVCIGHCNSYLPHFDRYKFYNLDSLNPGKIFLSECAWTQSFKEVGALLDPFRE